MKKVNLKQHPRTDHFNFFRAFDEPFYGVNINLECTEAYNYCKQKDISFYHYYLHKILIAVNAIPEMRYRIVEDEIFDVEVVHASATVLRDDKTFGYSRMIFDENFFVFSQSLRAEIDRIKSESGLDVMKGMVDVIHFTAIPWIKFTAISHARHLGVDDSMPKISTGKIYKESSEIFMPFSVHVNHSLVDGYHLGQFIEKLESLIK
ncbi:chloramphenicol O-acetyltransferase type A [Marivirga sericea]|uniref:Chloramphenicol O-acetyltransferase type A n=1 Tax=Marivirga sericea TaxID=1028 RepID=A0A1X7JN44_9BACT|nr:CatA-like O-acetyltransferase [Marivirga sericea]SMG29628.1 chloramphenicol O-acetyltransferase type A [Marivirga sericea]